MLVRIAYRENPDQTALFVSAFVADNLSVRNFITLTVPLKFNIMVIRRFRAA